MALLVLSSLVAAPAAAQRERASLGIAAERDGGEEARGDGVFLSGRARERIELQTATPLGPEPRRGDAIAYHRASAAMDARLGQVRIFGELATHLETGLNGPRVPISTDRFDVQQAFVDLSAGSPGAGARVRAGRQELSFEFVAVQDAPNVRRSWDGVRATGRLRGWELDAFVVSRAAPSIGVLDDSSRSSDRLTGVHLISPGEGSAPGYLSAYYYEVHQRQAPVFPQVADARIRILGATLDGQRGNFVYRLGGAIQRGRAGARGAIRAYALEAVSGLAWTRGRWKMRAAIRADAFSGGPPEPGRVRTFNPLFPNYAYSTEAALQSPSNLRKVGVDASAERRPLELRYRVEDLRLFSAGDALYGPIGVRPIAPVAGAGRHVGVQQQLLARWTAKGRTITAAFVHLDAGRFLRRAGRRGLAFAMLSSEWKF